MGNGSDGRVVKLTVLGYQNVSWSATRFALVFSCNENLSVPLSEMQYTCLTCTVICHSCVVKYVFFTRLFRTIQK